MLARCKEGESSTARNWSKAAYSNCAPGPLFVGPAKRDRVSLSLFVRVADVFSGSPSDRLGNLLGPVDRFLIGHCCDRVVPTVQIAVDRNCSKDFNDLNVREVLAQLDKVLGPGENRLLHVVPCLAQFGPMAHLEVLAILVFRCAHRGLSPQSVVSRLKFTSQAWSVGNGTLSTPAISSRASISSSWDLTSE